MTYKPTPPSLDEIAAALQGYDPKALRADTVNAFLAKLVSPVQASEDVGVFDALDRVLAEDVISPISVPPHDNSAMDGFAFRGSELKAGQSTSLRVVGTAYAGKAYAEPVGAGECVKIMTGAVMPEGLDTVIPVEFTQIEGEVLSFAADVVRQGDNRRCLGEDLMAGQPALRKGDRIGPAALGLIASLGLPGVKVWRKVKVAYFSTGDEILSLGEAPREGAVYDSNRYTVFGLLKRMNVDVLDMGVIADEPKALEAAFRSAAANADAIITSGGVSMGEADYTKAMMKKLGDVAFWRIAMRPGRPMAVGRLEENGRSAALFGLPGNPVAVMVTFLAFVRPALLKLMGSEAPAPVYLKARSAEALRKKPGRTEYQRGVVTREPDGGLTVRITGNQGSGVLRSMVEANGLIVLHHDQGNIVAGGEVDVMMFDGAI
ncbi:gephyrin-like molybdotransferase Glp [Hydrogenophaga sp. 5NK40-0174]|uniref:molybdopterin molybdotransferase MoeA n=1 Tax=Hydrogenophaga sp. 5NK40-0174 TaxID=3127649 RepID=UPI003105D219